MWPTKAKEAPSPHEVRWSRWTPTQFFYVSVGNASILLFDHGSIAVIFLFLASNIFVTTTAPAYTNQRWQLPAYPLSDGNLSLDSTVLTFSSMVMSLFEICIFIYITKTFIFSSSIFGTMQFPRTTSHSFINTFCPSRNQVLRTIPHFHFFTTPLHHVQYRQCFFVFLLNPTAIFSSRCYSSDQPTFSLLH